MSEPFPLYAWTKSELHQACSAAYNRYRRQKTDAAKTYFAARPQLKDVDHAYKARGIAAALPVGWEGLSDLIPPELRHRHHLSGNSSQLLALGLLGVARKLDPSHAWLWEAFSPLPPLQHDLAGGKPEVELEPAVLGEDPDHVTSVDYFVKDAGLVMCVECKWTEEGIGACSCKRAGGDPAVGRCRQAIRDNRPKYWQTAAEVFGLPGRKDGAPCPLSPVYQAVRNVAAALELSKPEGTGVFGLIFDTENPYFAGCGRWPGWPTVLQEVLDEAEPRLRFRAISWQELVPLLSLDDATRDWAAVKYGLGPTRSRDEMRVMG
jgi:hypothetical protein